MTRHTKEKPMLKHLAAGIAAAALLTAPALAQTAPAPAGGTPAQTSGSAGPASGQIMNQMAPDHIRVSKLMGVDVYGTDNQKIGDIDEVIVDRQGKIQAVVVGVGGFLGIGQKDVAIPYDQVQWMTSQEAQAQSNQGGAGAGTTNTAGGVTTPGGPGGGAGGTTGSTASTAGGAGGAGGTATGGAGGTAGGPAGAGAGTGGSDSTPARAMVKMTKADLQNATEFRYADEANRSSGGAGGGSGGTGAAGGAGGATQRP
jgi:sporulation protein YlmC with PRC-barrel domain